MAVVSLFSARELTPEAEFGAWWSLYPRKVAKKDAHKAWSKLRPTEQAAAMDALPAHVAHWSACGTESQFVPHPATWLNAARWEDELEPPRPRKPVESGPPWWSSHTLMERKGREVGVGPARPGETGEQYRARIHAAIEEQRRFGGNA